MERRKFLKSAGAGLALGAAAVPARAQALPEVKWRLASSYPKSLDTVYGGAEDVAKRVLAASGGKFRIQVFAAGELVPGGAVMDAVKDGTVEMGATSSYYYVGKDPTFAFDCAMPFGLNTRQQNAWMVEGGGMELMREFFAEYNIHNIPCGYTGAQMGGWFRKEIKTLNDLKGLKFRVGGFAGQVLSKLGVVPQQIPAGDIYPALEKGTIDAAEWIGPYDDEKLGFNKVAKYYYSPAFWEGSAQSSLYINKKLWDGLPKEYQGILEDACAEASLNMIGKYDARNPKALKRLIAGGTQLRAFSKEILDACFQATNELYEETAEKNPKFKKVYANWKAFRDEQIMWFGVAERAFDNYLASAVRPSAGKGK